MRLVSNQKGAALIMVTSGLSLAILSGLLIQGYLDINSKTSKTQLQKMVTDDLNNLAAQILADRNVCTANFVGQQFAVTAPAPINVAAIRNTIGVPGAILLQTPQVLNGVTLTQMRIVDFVVQAPNSVFTANLELQVQQDGALRTTFGAQSLTRKLPLSLSTSVVPMSVPLRVQINNCVARGSENTQATTADVCAALGGVFNAAGTPQCTGMTGSNSVPVGTILHFDLPNCPSGWTDYAAGQGRYILGLPASGTAAGTQGTAFTANMESRVTGTHSCRGTQTHYHNSNTGAAIGVVQWGTLSGNHSCPTGSPIVSNGPNTTNTATTGTTFSNTQNYGTNTATPAGTNAPYIQLKVCQKS